MYGKTLYIKFCTLTAKKLKIIARDKSTKSDELY